MTETAREIEKWTIILSTRKGHFVIHQLFKFLKDTNKVSWLSLFLEQKYVYCFKYISKSRNLKGYEDLTIISKHFLDIISYLCIIQKRLKLSPKNSSRIYRNVILYNLNFSQSSNINIFVAMIADNRETRSSRKACFFITMFAIFSPFFFPLF